MFCCLCFFFKDPATTEIYTYGHTLSLHDALPIYSTAATPRWHGRPSSAERRRDVRSIPRARRHGDAGRYRSASARSVRGAPSSVRRQSSLPCPAAPRSEEHTSELQSLMRISYAVFCLKKKKTTRHMRIKER